MSGDWKENEKFVLEKLDDHAAAHEKQADINRVQSDWNHKTDSRIDKIADRQTKIAMLMAALTASVVDNAGQFLDMIKGLFK